MHKVTIIGPRDGQADDGGIWGALGWVAKPRDLTASGLRACREREDTYVDLLQEVCGEFSQAHLVVVDPVVLKPPEPYLGEFRNGSRVSVDVASRLVRAMLRGGGSFGCGFVVPGVSLRIAVVSGDSLLIEAADELVALIEGKLPRSLAVTGQAEREDEWISVPADDVFWEAVRQDGIDRGQPVWVQERWAQGRYGERWFLADPPAINAVKRAVHANSAICAGAVDVPTETLSLGEIFDEVTAHSADGLELFVLPEPMSDGPDLGATPLDARLLLSGSVSLSDPVRVMYPRKFSVDGETEPGERLWFGVAPDPEGGVRARWLGLPPSGS